MFCIIKIAINAIAALSLSTMVVAEDYRIDNKILLDSNLRIKNVVVKQRPIGSSEFIEDDGLLIKDLPFKTVAGRALNSLDIFSDIEKLEKISKNVSFIVEKEGKDECSVVFFVDKSTLAGNISINIIKDIDESSSSEIKNAIISLIDFKSSSPVSEDSIQESIKSLLNNLREKYRIYDIKIDPVYSYSPDGKVNITLNVDPGVRWLIDKVVVKGVTQKEYNAFKRNLIGSSQYKLMYPYSIFSSVSSYNSILMNISMLEAFFKSKGYSDVSVSYQMDEDSKTLIYNVDKGMQYVIDNASIVGNEVISDEVLYKVLKTWISEEPIVFSQSSIDSIVKEVKKIYGNSGMVDTSVSVNIDSINKNRVSLSLKIKEGKMYKVGRLMITGNYTTSKSLILGDVEYLPGSIINISKIEKSIERLSRRSMFKRVTYKIEPSDLGDNVKDIFIIVKEKKRFSANLNLSLNPAKLSAPGGVVVLQKQNLPNLLTFTKYCLNFNDEPYLRGDGIDSYLRLNIQGFNLGKLDAKFGLTVERLGGTNLGLSQELGIALGEAKDGNADIVSSSTNLFYYVESLEMMLRNSIFIEGTTQKPIYFIDNKLENYAYGFKVGADISNGLIQSTFKFNPILNIAYNYSEMRFRYDLISNNFINLKVGFDAVTTSTIKAFGYDKQDISEIPSADQIIVGSSANPKIRLRGYGINKTLANSPISRDRMPGSAALLFFEISPSISAPMTPIAFFDVAISSRKPLFGDIGSLRLNNEFSDKATILCSFGVVFNINIQTPSGRMGYPSQIGFAKAINPLNFFDEEGIVMSISM